MRVLVADDDASLLEVLCRGLGEHGCSADSVTDGAGVLEAVRHVDYDVVVLDWRMPRLNGVQALSLLRGQGRSVPVLMLSACDSSADRVTAMRAGANAYLLKPFRFNELVDTVRALHRSSSDGPETPREKPTTRSDASGCSAVPATSARSLDLRGLAQRARRGRSR